MKNSILFKTLIIGIIGGSLPLVIFLTTQKNPTETTNETKYSSDYLIDGHRKTPIYNANFSGTNSIDFREASKNSINSVVHVTTKVVHTSFQRDIFQEFFYGPGAGGKEFKQFGSGAGSGVFISSKGYIVTNNHVIDNASEIQVILNDNSKYDATIVGTDPSTDIAVIKIEGENFPSIPLGNSDDLEIGEWVLAVGNPFNLTSTVTAGIVSAKARNINLLNGNADKNIFPIESFIQTDAAVNPGNSGGALVNSKGELVGINTAIASQTGSYSGYSFAVPVNLVQKVMRDLIDYGVVQRGYLGVQIADITQEIQTERNLPDLKGVYVAGVVEDGSAEKAGLKEGDVIMRIGTKEVNSSAALQEEIGKMRPGDKVAVTIRNSKGAEQTKEVVLRNKEGQTDLITKEEVKKNYSLGATFENLTEKEKRSLNIDYGVKIKTITAGKLKSLGLKEGVIISKINNEPVKTIEQLTSKLNDSNRGILLEIMSSSGRKDYVGFGL
ncbi:Do family serine endopeptidase [Crocinitomicaceae bacterium]|nr:Do family serine endopeptidase [Crocinitomicaceae bacterium]MDB4682453.1 Do family serine endopeptidase [Crocinitomicaceae bacterium]